MHGDSKKQGQFPGPFQTPRGCAWNLDRPMPDKLMDVSFACAVLDAVPQQFAVLDAGGIVVAANAAWRNYSGTRAGPMAPCIGAGFGSAADDAVLASCARRREYAVISPT